MKHIILSVMVLLAATTLAFGQKDGNGTKKISGDEQAIRQILNDIGIALNRSDTPALNELYADDYTFVNPLGVMLTKEQALAGLRSGEVKFESFSHEDINVRRYGDTAVVTARVTAKGKFRGQDLQANSARATLTLVKIKGRWKVAAAQSTNIVEQ